MAEEFLMLAEDLLRPVSQASQSWNIDVANVLQYFLNCTEKGMITLENTAQDDDGVEKGEVNGGTIGGESQGINSYIMEFTQAAMIVEKSAKLLSQKIEHLHHLAYAALKNLNFNFKEGGGTVGGTTKTKSNLHRQINYFDEEEEEGGVFTIPHILIGKKIEMEDEEIVKEENAFEEDERTYLRAPAILMSNEKKKNSAASKRPVYLGDINEHTNLHLVSSRLEYRHALILDESDLINFSCYFNECKNVQNEQTIKKDENENENEDALMSNSRKNLPSRKKTNTTEDNHSADPTEGMGENSENVAANNKDNQKKVDTIQENIKIGNAHMIGMNKVIGIFEQKDDAVEKNEDTQTENQWIYMEEDKCFGKDKPLKLGHKMKPPPACYQLHCKEIDDPSTFFRCMRTSGLQNLFMGFWTNEELIGTGGKEKEKEKEKEKRNNNMCIPYFNDLRRPTLYCEKVGLDRRKFSFCNHLLCKFAKQTLKKGKDKRERLDGEFEFERGGVCEKEDFYDENENEQSERRERDSMEGMHFDMHTQDNNNMMSMDYDNYDNYNDTDEWVSPNALNGPLDDLIQCDLELALERAKEFYETAFKNHISEWDKYENEVSYEALNDEVDLHLRVRRWNEFLEPELEKLSLLPAFDINRYKKHVLKKVLVNEKQASFEDIVQGQPKYEVCRTFLTALMLTNLQQLDICTQKDDEAEAEGEKLADAHGSFVVKLLATEDTIESIPDEDDLIDLPALVHTNELLSPNKKIDKNKTKKRREISDEHFNQTAPHTSYMNRSTPKRQKSREAEVMDEAKYAFGKNEHFSSDIFDSENAALCLKKPIILKTKISNAKMNGNCEGKNERNDIQDEEDEEESYYVVEEIDEDSQAQNNANLKNLEEKETQLNEEYEEEEISEEEKEENLKTDENIDKNKQNKHTGRERFGNKMKQDRKKEKQKMKKKRII